MSVTVLTKPGCAQCNATYRALEKKEIPYQSSDVYQDPNSMQIVQDLGYMQMPVVVVRDENGEIIQHWSGLNKENIAGLAENN